MLAGEDLQAHDAEKLDKGLIVGRLGNRTVKDVIQLIERGLIVHGRLEFLSASHILASCAQERRCAANPAA